MVLKPAVAAASRSGVRTGVYTVSATTAPGGQFRNASDGIADENGSGPSFIPTGVALMIKSKFAPSNEAGTAEAAGVAVSVRSDAARASARAGSRLKRVTWAPDDAS